MKSHYKSLFAILFTIVLVLSCGFQRNSIKNYQGKVDDLLLPANKEQDLYDVRDMNSCGIDFDLGKWEKSKHLSGTWKREVSSIKGHIISYGEYLLDYKPKKIDPSKSMIPNSSITFSSSPKYHIVYIGPWKYNSEIGNKIRFVSYQLIDYKNPRRLNYHGTLYYFFESQNKGNEKIKEKEFSLLKNGRASKLDICTVKWVANYGYNAIAEVKSKFPFSKNYLKPTGRIIDVETGEIIVESFY